MITVKQADKIITSNLRPYPGVKIPLKEAYERILKEDIRADRDIPALSKSILDGIAISFAAWKQGRRQFKIQGVQAAGGPALTLKSQENCIEIMTGAALPLGCDCVIGVEDIKVKNNLAVLSSKLSLRAHQNIHEKGSTHKRGETLLKKGVTLNGPQIATIASVGKSRVMVSPQLHIAVISTGDELVEINKLAKPYQVRLSNSYALQAAFEQTGLFRASIFHIKDNKKELQRRIQTILQQFDVIVLSGGVSKGKFDYVPQVLEKLGVKVLFHKVRQKPGKPFWFGTSRTHKPVFALPGNPVATLVCTYRYVMVHLRKALGQTSSAQEYALISNFKSRISLVSFLPVRIQTDTKGQLSALPVGYSGSADFVSLSQANAFLELPPGPRTFSNFAAKCYRL